MDHNRPSYQSVLFVLGGTTLVFLLIATILLLYAFHQDSRSKYDGGEIYDLTECYPYETYGNVEMDEINMLAPVFTTNSTQITLTNNNPDDITLFLYDMENPTTTYIGIMTLSTGEGGKFTMLTGARKYKIGFKTLSPIYNISVSD